MFRRKRWDGGALEALMKVARDALASEDLKAVGAARTALSDARPDVSAELLEQADTLTLALEGREEALRVARVEQALRPCPSCGATELFLSKPGHFKDITIAGAVQDKLGFRLVLCGQCGRVDIFALDVEGLKEDDCFELVRARGTSEGPFR